MIMSFKNNDEEYELWCNSNKNGYVFNYFGGTDARADMNKIHKVNCSYLWRKADEEKRTAPYEKVCLENLEELIGLVNNERGSSWSYCKGNLCFEHKDQ